MTLTEAEKVRLKNRLSSRFKPMLQEYLEKGMAGQVVGDDDVWATVLDWVGSDLQRMLLYGPEVKESERGEKSPFYKKFELFHRVRMQGELDGPFVKALSYSLILSIEEVGAKAKDLFRIRDLTAKTEGTDGA